MFLLHVTYMTYVKCAVLTEFGQLLRLQTHFTVSSVHSQWSSSRHNLSANI